MTTIVFVHGAWHTPAHYEAYLFALRAQGFPVYSPQLPSCSNDDDSTSGLADDVACVRELLSHLIDTQGRSVLMIMHSYGGVVGTEALLPSLTASQRSKDGSESHGGVTHLLYVAAYALQAGNSVSGTLEECGWAHLWPLNFDLGEDRGGRTLPRYPKMMFYGDVADEDLVERETRMLLRIPMSVFTTPASSEVWRDVPFTYVSTLQDNALPKNAQDLMLNKIRAKGVQFSLVELDTCHTPFLTRQEEMVKIVRDIDSC
ncbi:hypothetical protein ASPZODRAFT_72285 [Penicilliopsis zonata CBS 506.65]|uniref:AB hydrolase-1 domain-containing protein n=1 Tax=Penicilliopsis zonata CBS 506.65 TaxID=1073090 RepID=A0A1L9SA37_9EURO|nr:hypothetical protein ASPZODRAFT_72285 [Penicilliopsis zonata CBS 506.65]OJJ44018.1 hypothetical protein ASPZODRAFT_72285 [Penicilliopsis zonata CBS 506.65]